MSLTIGITGLGYVGLPLALRFAEAGATVRGFDIDPKKVAQLEAGESYIRHITPERIAAAVAGGRFAATTDFARIAECDAVLICVPTPLTRNREPDLSFVLGTARLIGPHLRRGALVCLESTTYPGTTDEALREVLEETSGLTAGVDFHLAYSPEREDPGNPASDVAQIPKVVGGLTPACRDRALAVYGLAIEKLVPVSSCRAAEATKLMENIFRSVNIALVNELKVVYEAMGIDIWEVIAAAKTKPFGYMPFYPGPGLGGHCIPIDPFYLTWKAREFGKHTRFIELAGEINTSMPDYVVGKVIETLNADGKAVKGARILLLGLAYKANVDDDRESPSYILIEKLEALGAVVSYNDPYVPEIRPSREHAALAGRRSVEISNDFDLLLLVTAHDAYRTFDFSGLTVPVVDSRGCVDPATCRVIRS
jgi:UDP-N-acetyl-D-glucosamine dehydrogenase